MERCEDLVRMTAAGDRAAFRRLYDLTSPKLYGIVRQMIRNKEQSEELLQEVYLKIWREAARYDAAKSPAMSWLVILTRRIVIDELRRSVLPTTSIDEDETLLNTLESQSDDADPLAHDRLHTCFGKLRDEYRRAIMLAYINGRTYEEISKQLEKPVGTLRTWVHRGLADLRNCMG